MPRSKKLDLAWEATLLPTHSKLDSERAGKIVKLFLLGVRALGTKEKRDISISLESLHALIPKFAKRHNPLGTTRSYYALHEGICTAVTMWELSEGVALPISYLYTENLSAEALERETWLLAREILVGAGTNFDYLDLLATIRQLLVEGHVLAE